MSFVIPFIIRVKHPEIRGPFRIPGGLPGLLLVALPPALISIFLIVTIGYDKLFLGLGCIAAGPVSYFVLQWSAKRSEAPGP